MLNPKLEILNTKQTQMFKTQKSGTKEEQIMEERSLSKEGTELTTMFVSIVERLK
jgi:hypothetical protein